MTSGKLAVAVAVMGCMLWGCDDEETPEPDPMVEARIALCEAVSSGPGEEVVAIWAREDQIDEYPTVSSGSPQAVTLVSNDEEMRGMVEFTPTTTGRYFIGTPSYATLRLKIHEGMIVGREDFGPNDECEDAQRYHLYRLQAEQPYVIQFGPTGEEAIKIFITNAPDPIEEPVE